MLMKLYLESFKKAQKQKSNHFFQNDAHVVTYETVLEKMVIFPRTR